MALYDGPQPSPSPGATPRTGTDPKSRQDVINQIMAGDQPTGGGASPKDPPVFLGWGESPKGLGGFALTPKVTQKVSEVKSQYYGWDQATKDKFLSQAALAGYDVNNMRDGQLAALWGSYVEQAANYFGGGANITPWDIMAKDRAQREAYMNTPRTVTQKSTAYDLSSEGDARAIFYSAAQSLLGRDPTKAEVSQFQKSLNAMERANPTVTTTTSNYIGDTLQSQTSTSEGGVKEGARQMMSMDQAKANPEYGAYQAATTYFDALMRAIGGIE